MGYHSEACQDVRAIMDAKFYNTNTSMLNLYAKCLYQKVEVAEGKTHMRVAHGKVPVMAPGVICEDMYGITKWFNEGTIQTQLHVDLKKF